MAVIFPRYYIQLLIGTSDHSLKGAASEHPRKYIKVYDLVI